MSGREEATDAAPKARPSVVFPREYRVVVFLCDPSLPSGDFVVVTACNPEGRILEPWENQEADRAFEHFLEGLGRPHFRATGMSPDGRHREPGWAVFCGVGDGRRMATALRQVGFYAISDGRLTLHHTQSGQFEDLGRWEDFVSRETSPPYGSGSPPGSR